MARTSSAVAVVKIRQTYNRFGKPYCSIGIPRQVLDTLGWKPGEFLMVYVTKDQGMKAMPAAGNAGDDFDQTAVAPAEEMKGAKPGSIYEAELRADSSLEEMIAEFEKEAGVKTRPRAGKERKKRA